MWQHKDFEKKKQKDFEKQEQNKIIKIKSLKIQILLNLLHYKSQLSAKRDGERKKLNI